MKKSIVVVIILTLILFILLIGCNSNIKKETQQSSIIKIGVIEPITGINASGGKLEVEGIILANEMYPTVIDKKVEIVIVDNKSSKVESANAAITLVDDEKVSAVIGSWGSSFSIAAGPIFKDASVPAVGASCTNPKVTLGNDYYSRVCFIDLFQGKVMANYAYNELGAKKVAIIQENSSDYSVGLANYFEKSFINFTFDENSIVCKESYDTGEQNFMSQLKNIKKLNPDVIFAPSNYIEGALLVNQARKLGIDAPFIATDTWENPEFLKLGGEAVEGVVFSTFFTSEISITQESEKFLNAYRKKYSKEPSSVAALAYDAYLVILNSIEKSGSTNPEEINNYIRQTKNFEGAAGIISLNSTGDAIKSAIIKEVKNGQFKYLTIVDPMQ